MILSKSEVYDSKKLKFIKEEEACESQYKVVEE